MWLCGCGFCLLHSHLSVTDEAKLYRLVTSSSFCVQFDLFGNRRCVCISARFFYCIAVCTNIYLRWCLCVSYDYTVSCTLISNTKEERIKTKMNVYILFVPRCLVRNCVCSLPRVIISLSASLASLLVHNSHSLASFSSAPLFDTILYCTIVDQHVFDTTELFCAASVRAPQCVCIHLLLSQHTDPCGRLHGSQTNRSTAHIHNHI